MADPETAPSPVAPPPPPPQLPEIPKQGRPLPVLAQRETPPSTQGQAETGLPQVPSNSEPTPADKALAAMGGDIVPPEFQAKPLPVADNPAAKKDTVEVPGGREIQGNPAPPPPVETEEQKAWREQLAGLINVELNIYNNCFRSVRNMVNQIVASTPMDAADLGEAQWSAGKRSPIEQAEPEIALEVYRQVRLEMRASEKEEDDEDLKALRRLMGKRKRQ
jgi:hypothetical protein